MSGASSPASRSQKAMSSRLLTMKFMQRAAASSPTASPSTPTPPDASSLKRRRGNDDSPASDVNEMANQAKIRAAIEEEEARNQAVMDKVAAEAGETRWVLNFDAVDGQQAGMQTPIRVVHMGFADVDKDSTTSRGIVKLEYPVNAEESERPALAGRKSFGKFNKAIEKLHNPDAESSSDSDSSDADVKDEDVESESDDEDGTKALFKQERVAAAQKFREERKQKKRDEKKELLRLGELRRKKDVNLKGLAGISNQGSSNFSGTCHICEEVGHMSKDCPKKRRSSGAFEGHKPKKPRKSY